MVPSARAITTSPLYLEAIMRTNGYDNLRDERYRSIYNPRSEACATLILSQSARGIVDLVERQHDPDFLWIQEARK
jgi:hypothetical protein